MLLIDEKELRKVAKELEAIFGRKAVERVFSHLNSINQRVNTLQKSRDHWKAKHKELKELCGK